MGATLNFRRQGGWSMTGAGGTPVGSRGFSRGFRGAVAFQTGTGTNQVDTVYESVGFTLAAGATLLIDMKGGTGEKDLINLTLSLSRVRWLYLELATPAASTSLRFGPQNQTNAWQGPWSGVGATAYVTVVDAFDMPDGYNNWSVVDSTHKILAVNNPGAASVTASLVVAGVA